MGSGILKLDKITLEEAMERYEFLKNYEQELDFVKNIIDRYKSNGVFADFRHIRVNPSNLIATQKYVEDVEYEVISNLVKRGIYTVPIVTEFHPEMHKRYVLDGHNRTRYGALEGENLIEAFDVFFPDEGCTDTGTVSIAAVYGDVYVKYMPIGSKNVA